MQTFFIGLIKALGRLPLGWLRALSNGIAIVVELLKPSVYWVTTKNIQTAFPALSDGEQQGLIRLTIRQNIRVMMETPYVWTRAAAAIKQLYTADDQALSALQSQEQAFIVLAPHIGNWELLGYFLGEHYDNASMYLPSRQGATFDAFIKSARSRFGNRLLPASGEGVRAFYQHLKSNKPVSILPDQSPASESGMVYATFFDEIAATIVLPAKVARKCPVPTFLGYAVYDPQVGHYQIEFRSVPGFGLQADLVADVQLMNDAIEQLVRDYPEQYLWTYKRFKRRPSDDPLHAQFYDRIK